MNTQTSDDYFLGEPIPEIRTFMALHSESYKLVSNSSFSHYLEGLAFMAQDESQLALESFKQGSMKGNPYCQYLLYTLYASKNESGIKENRETALYYLISCVLNFSIGLINEDKAHIMLYKYIKKFDDPKKSMSSKVLNKIQDDKTNFDKNKDIADALFQLLMVNSVETRENLRKSLKNSNSSDGMYSLIELRFCHIEDGFSVIEKESFDSFIIDYCYELILYFNRTGLMDCEKICKAQRDSFLICFYFIVFKGKRLGPEFDILVSELLEFCNLVTKDDKIKTNEIEEDGKSILYELKPILYLVKAYFYLNGRFLAKSNRKAKEFLQKFDKCKAPKDYLLYLADFLSLKCYFKLWKTYKEPENIGKLFQNFFKLYNLKTLNSSKSKVIEYYIAGYIQEKHFKDIKEARNFYKLGLEIPAHPDDDFIDIMCYYAFRKKCEIASAEPDKDDLID